MHLSLPWQSLNKLLFALSFWYNCAEFRNVFSDTLCHWPKQWLQIILIFFSNTSAHVPQVVYPSIQPELKQGLNFCLYLLVPKNLHSELICASKPISYGWILLKIWINLLVTGIIKVKQKTKKTCLTQMHVLSMIIQKDEYQNQWIKADSYSLVLYKNIPKNGDYRCTAHSDFSPRWFTILHEGLG